MYLNPNMNHVLIKKIASPNVQERISALNEVDKVLLERANTTGVARRYFKGLSATDTAGEGLRIVTPADSFYDTLTSEKPAVVYYMQPDPKKEIYAPNGRAVVIGPDASPRILSFGGQRYTESFERLATDARTKSVKELYVYPYDIVTFFENYSHKDLLDKEDFLFFRLINGLLEAGRATLAGKNIMVANESTFSAIQFSHLKDMHSNKQIPFSRLLSHFSMLNTKERTVESEIRNVAYEGINGNTSMETMFGMTPLSLETKQYCYYSFDKAHEDNEDEKEQSFINLDNVLGKNVAEFAAIADETERNAAAEVIKDYMTGMGYKWNEMSNATGLATYGTGYEFCRFLDADNFYPRIPITGDDYEEATASASYKSIVAVVGKTMMRNYVLTTRQYFGHFDLFLEDAQTFVEKNNQNILFHVEEEMIMTAKNYRAVTCLDVWKPIIPAV